MTDELLRTFAFLFFLLVVGIMAWAVANSYQWGEQKATTEDIAHAVRACPAILTMMKGSTARTPITNRELGAYQLECERQAQIEAVQKAEK